MFSKYIGIFAIREPSSRTSTRASDSNPGGLNNGRQDPPGLIEKVADPGKTAVHYRMVEMHSQAGNPKMLVVPSEFSNRNIYVANIDCITNGKPSNFDVQRSHNNGHDFS
jgi:hypothetical protein